VSTDPLPQIGVSSTDSDLLADIIWFIKGRMSALADQGRNCELGADHIDALRRFRLALPVMGEIRHRADAAEHREKLAKHFASLRKKGKA
jgi:hypothetical protein